METREISSGFSPVRQSTLFSPLPILAGLSVVMLVGAVFFGMSRGSHQEYRGDAQPAAVAHISSGSVDLSMLTNEGVATSDIAMVGPSVVGVLAAQYQQLQDSGSYTPEAANQAAQALAQDVSIPVAFKHYSVSDIKTSSDTSYSAMLQYRAKLKDALAPMTEVSDLEIAVFGKYEQSKDPKYLAELQDIIATYEKASHDAASLLVPQDAASYHLGILNAMGEFGATLQALADNADDPITTVTLLKSYNDAESTMISSFDTLAQYYAHHLQT